jgi:1,4-alpha-glucan branching enzyme
MPVAESRRGAREKARGLDSAPDSGHTFSMHTHDAWCGEPHKMQKPGSVIHGPSLLTDHDIYLFKEGSHFKLHEKLGSHVHEHEGVRGVLFSVWAPNAKSVSVMGDFNGWDRTSHPLAWRWDESGIWEGFVPGIGHGEHYKYYVQSHNNGYCVEKADPYAQHHETPPHTASIVWETQYAWRDAEWMAQRGARNAPDAPVSIYEVHAGSWRRVPHEGARSLNYRELGEQLAEYCVRMNFTHVELMPIMEHPFDGSWGYQLTGFFAPTSRFGAPEDFMYLVDVLHEHGIGVILDWVPSHFPSDEHGLVYFDGTHLYEHADPRQGFHPDWKSYIFNYSRSEVRNFLISSALIWLDKYHIDGLRVDAVASMLYLDYSRENGEWIPNQYGGRENIDAISFLKRFNEMVYGEFPDTMTMAEESTAWPMVSRPVYVGGLGFGMKWKMGWMHDSLEYMQLDPIYRKFHHNMLTFSMIYAFNENYVLPLSHDEVVHGKGSLIRKMPGDDWQRFANLRALFGYMYSHPGKKLLFMGGEFGQWNEWYHKTSLDWHLLDQPLHAGLSRWVRDLNRVYRDEPALHELDFYGEGFAWVDYHDYESNVISYLRRGRKPEDVILVVCNFSPVPRYNYNAGAPHPGVWREVLNSDAAEYGGSGIGNLGSVQANNVSSHGHYHTLVMALPPLGFVAFKPESVSVPKKSEKRKSSKK